MKTMSRVAVLALFAFAACQLSVGQQEHKPKKKSRIEATQAQPKLVGLVHDVVGTFVQIVVSPRGTNFITAVEGTIRVPS